MNGEGRKTGHRRKEESNKKGKTETAIIKIMFWNVTGIRTMRNEDWKELSGKDIIGLTETWQKKGNDEWIGKNLKEFDIRTIQAKREHKKGRAKGGLMLAIRKGLKAEVEWLEGESKEVIGMKIRIRKERWLIALAYMREQRGKNWETLEEWMEDMREENIIIGGDFNARVGKEGGRWTEEGIKEERESKDEVINEEGRQMIKWIEEEGLGIANGCTEGHREGDWTYIGARG